MPHEPRLQPRPDQVDASLVTKVLQFGVRAQVWLYRRTNGRVGGTWRIGAGSREPVPTLLLDHLDRQSGGRFTVPLLYLVDGADLVVVASQAGTMTDPEWYRNLLAHPDTQVQVGAELRRVRARVASPTERGRLRPRLVELYAGYRSQTEREIRVVVLEPR